MVEMLFSEHILTSLLKHSSFGESQTPTLTLLIGSVFSRQRLTPDSILALHQRTFTSRDWDRFWAVFQGGSRKLDKVDVGYYPTILHAYNALEETDEYEYR